MYEHLATPGNPYRPGVRDLQLWRDIWGINLHGRHALLLWKWCHNAVPTLDRLHHVIQILDRSCYICGAPEESIHHLVFQCLLSCLIWADSPWQVRIDSFQNLQFSDWVSLMIGKHNPLPIGATGKSRLTFFLVSAIELIWLFRNKKWKGLDCPSWQEVSRSVNVNAVKHWHAGNARLQLRKTQRISPSLDSWRPPC